MKPKRVSKRVSKRVFAKTASNPHPKNVRPVNMRGGIRL